MTYKSSDFWDTVRIVLIKGYSLWIFMNHSLTRCDCWYRYVIDQISAKNDRPLFLVLQKCVKVGFLWADENTIDYGALQLNEEVVQATFYNRGSGYYQYYGYPLSDHLNQNIKGDPGDDSLIVSSTRTLLMLWVGLC